MGIRVSKRKLLHEEVFTDKVQASVVTTFAKGLSTRLNSSEAIYFSTAG